MGDTFSTFAPGTTPRVSTSRTSATLYPHQAHFVVGKILVGGKVSECAHAARPTHPRLPTAKLTCSNSHVGLCCKRIGGAATSKGSGKSLGHARQHTRQHAGQHAGHRVEPPLQSKLMPLQSELILVTVHRDSRFPSIHATKNMLSLGKQPSGIIWNDSVWFVLMTCARERYSLLVDTQYHHYPSIWKQKAVWMCARCWW